MKSIECQAEDYDGTRVYASGPTRQEALKNARKHLLESRKRSQAVRLALPLARATVAGLPIPLQRARPALALSRRVAHGRAEESLASHPNVTNLEPRRVLLDRRWG